MTPKARHMRNSPQEKAISVDELFAAAFHNSTFFFQRESLLGWRPVIKESNPFNKDGAPKRNANKLPEFTNSHDINVNETSEAILIEVALPEIDEESLYLEISGDLLIVRALRVEMYNNGNGKNEELPMVHRYVKLPITAQPGNVKARLENNVLMIIINKPWAGIRD